MNKKIKALIVDDSSFMRSSLTRMMEDSGEIEVIAEAKDGFEAVEAVKSKSPDIVTLDIDMPKMDGLTALTTIMNEFPVPVLMVSSLTQEGAAETLKALELGAIDFIPKDLSEGGTNFVKLKDLLVTKIKTIVSQQSILIRLKRIQKLNLSKKNYDSSLKSDFKSNNLPKIGYKAIGLGISTGGPMSLQKVIPLLSANLPVPMFIVQHMPPKFTKSLAERLNEISGIEVKEAEDREIVRPGVGYIAPGGFHMSLANNNENKQIIISDKPSDTLYRPSVNLTLSSLVQVYSKHVLGIIMTGMGRDGADAIKELKSIGGYSIAQNEETSIVYGMPKAIVDAGHADLVLPLETIAETINRIFE